MELRTSHELIYEDSETLDEPGSANVGNAASGCLCLGLRSTRVGPVPVSHERNNILPRINLFFILYKNHMLLHLICQNEHLYHVLFFCFLKFLIYRESESKV